MKITFVELLTNDILAVKAFYNDTLGFTILEESNEYISFKIGHSQLAFKYSETYQNPTYHYALSIPENQFSEAKKWLSERVSLVKDENGEDEFDFVNWNANAMYFFDSVGNIGELIARHDLDNSTNTPFSINSITEISEIALPQKDVLNFAHKVETSFGIPIYLGGSAAFAPLGSPEGLFICVPLHRIWYPTQDLKSDLFPISIRINALKEDILTHEVYTIQSKKVIM